MKNYTVEYSTSTDVNDLTGVAIIEALAVLTGVAAAALFVIKLFVY